MWARALLLAGSVVLAGALAAAGCASGQVDKDEDETTGSAGGSSSSSGGQAGEGGAASPCGIDCSTIDTPPCKVAQCNTGTGQCEVVSDADGTICDDGQFCTVDDACVAGECQGGPQNDCGLDPPPCNEITCDEQAQSCSETPAMNGSACQDPTNLCIQGSTCNNGVCIGGTLNDCFFFPVPDECHIAECNPLTGMCEAIPGNDGASCVDPNDLCTVGKSCLGGSCQGGAPKNCSHLSQGCVLGVCDTTNGMCITQNLMNGDPCDDADACTTGETCQTGTCTNGAPVTACVNNDGCCPSSCNGTNDVDCLCTSGMAQFNATGMGSTGTIQSFTVPTGCSQITIEAWGAQGGTGTDTRGARMKGSFTVTPGEVLSILVGHQAASNGLAGGGGTFVVDAANQPLLIAGGGGSCFSNCPLSAETVGRVQTSGGTAGATVRADNGNGGNVANGTSGGGGGFFGNGANATGGTSWANGMLGGVGENHGGFGGGGARGGLWGQGGGGGYSGGSCGDQASSWFGCGGGGSFNGGTSQDNAAGVRVGHGMVVITW